MNEPSNDVRSRWAAPHPVLICGAAGAVVLALAGVLLGLGEGAAHLIGVHLLSGVAGAVIALLAVVLLLRGRPYRAGVSTRVSNGDRTEIIEVGQFRENVIESAHVWINSLDADARVTLWNRAAERISGYAREEVLGRADIWTKLYPDPEYRAEIVGRVDEILEGITEVEDFETRIQCKDGRQRTIAWDSRRLYGDRGQTTGSVAIGRDVTAAREVEQDLRASERQLATLMSSLPGMAYRCLDDEHWTLRFASAGCRDLTGYEPDELIDNRVRSLNQLILPEDRDHVAGVAFERLDSGSSFEVEYRLRKRDGTVIWIWEQGRYVVYDDGRLVEGIMLDITQRKAAEQELQHLATRDQLTGLFNRRELDRRVRRELARAIRYDRPFSLLWFDLDHFKQVNDRFGHLAGDAVLRQVSRQLQDALRSVDCIARYGGEELVALLPEMELPEATGTAERLRELVASSTYAVTGEEWATITTSVGVATYPDHGTTAEALYGAADHAMYRAKHEGRNTVRRAGETRTAECNVG